MYWNANSGEYNDVLYALSTNKVGGSTNKLGGSTNKVGGSTNKVSGSTICSNAMIIVSPVPCNRIGHEAV